MSSPEITQPLVRATAASRARSFTIGGGVAAAAAAFVILVGTASSDRVSAVFWLFGLAFGFVLQRSRFCFASAFRDLFLLGDARVMKGIIAGLAVATAGFAVVMARMLPEVGFGSLPPGATVLPLGLHTLLGGVLFGIGMVLAGGCTSGSLYRAGEGYVGPGAWRAISRLQRERGTLVPVPASVPRGRSNPVWRRPSADPLSPFHNPLLICPPRLTSS